MAPSDFERALDEGIAGYLDFRKRNAAVSLSKLLLKFNGRWPESQWTLWMGNERKLKDKIPSDWFDRGWICPLALSAEQCSAYGLARQIDWGSGGKALDVCAGLGIDAAAMAESGFSVTALESNPVLARALDHNFAVLEHQITVLPTPAEVFFEKNTDRFDLLYADPDRRPADRKALALEDCRPNPVDQIAVWKNRASRVWIKLSPMFDADEAIRRLGESHLEAVEAWSWNGEVKELLVRYGAPTTQPAQRRVRIAAHNAPLLCMESDWNTPQPSVLDRSSSLDLPPIASGQILADPAPALHKMHLYAALGQRYPDAVWISPTTHWMLFQTPPVAFPGKIYRLLRKFDRKQDRGSALEPLLRNYPDKAEVLRKQHRLLPGGRDRLVGFRNAHGQIELWIAEALP